MDPDDETESYELALPFVVVKSEGGPFDDEAYVCGFEAGQLDSRLAQISQFLDDFSTGIHAANRKQADLIAMRYGFTMEVEPCDCDDEWIHVTFTRMTDPTCEP
jgi:hypothetical protein